jgi:hypothetical protein
VTPADLLCVSDSSPSNGRTRGRLHKARELGYLNAACDPRLAVLHSQWCWRLKIPVIWMERRSPHSRFGRVHLDLFTTPRALTLSGRTALQALTERLAIGGTAVVSPHDACWDRVPVRQLEDLACAVFRAVNRPGNYQWDLPQPVANQGPAKLLPFRERATA